MPFNPELAQSFFKTTELVRAKTAELKAPTIDREQRLLKALVSTPGVDMDNEVVLQSFDTSFFPDLHRAVYLDHRYETEGRVAAVGVCRNMVIRPEGTRALTYVLPGALGDDILTAIEAEALMGTSIGFITLDAGPPTEDEVKSHGTVSSVVRHSRLLEYSLTSMPANQEALIRLESLATDGKIHRKSAGLMGLPGCEPERKAHPTYSPKPGAKRLVLGEWFAFTLPVG